MKRLAYSSKLYKKTLGNPKCRWEVNIKLDLKEIRWNVKTKFDWLRI
jgi:hypothetical protein